MSCKWVVVVVRKNSGGLADTETVLGMSLGLLIKPSDPLILLLYKFMSLSIDLQFLAAGNLDIDNIQKNMSMNARF
jgi:hypothetical protein